MVKELRADAVFKTCLTALLRASRAKAAKVQGSTPTEAAVQQAFLMNKRKPSALFETAELEKEALKAGVIERNSDRIRVRASRLLRCNLRSALKPFALRLHETGGKTLLHPG